MPWWCFSISGLKGSGIRASLLIGIIVVRYIFLPLLGIAIVKGAVQLGLVNPDPLYQFVLLLQYALPPAMNIGMEIHLKHNSIIIWVLIEKGLIRGSCVMWQAQSRSCLEQARANVLSSCCGHMPWRQLPSRFGPPCSCGL